jgi:predicted phosphodiesterase
VHYPEVAKQLCESGQYDFVFYGHTHKPWEENIGNCKMLNPGNVANQYYPPTFAAWNTSDNQFKLIRINELE